MLSDSFDEDLDSSEGHESEKPEKKRAPRKKYIKKRAAVPAAPCPHCGQIYSFSSFYCVCCKDHHHTLFQSRDNKDWCSDCYRGMSSQGQAYRRANRTWRPLPITPASYDFPEWYEMSQEHCNSTIMPLWINDELDNIA